MRKKEPKTLYISDILKEFKSLSYDGSDNTPQPLSKEMAGKFFRCLYGIALCEIREELHRYTKGITEKVNRGYQRDEIISLSGTQVGFIIGKIEDMRDELIERGVNSILKNYGDTPTG